jgi:hypothetical protein
LESPKVVIGRLIDNEITFKPMTISKETEWLKWLAPEELAEFTKQLLKLVSKITKGKKTVDDLELFISEWHETALIYKEKGILEDITEAELELSAGGGKDWNAVKEEIGI